MMRLVQLGLIYGNLYEVSSPSMVARYNRALEHLTGRRTGLDAFHIDISGYSPEIGDEFGDELYLNPSGCNRQFILLSVEQKTAPLLNAKFSTSRTILRRFIDENEEQLFALSIRDCVVGELVNSIYSLTSPQDLFHLTTIHVEADTVGGHSQASEELADRIDRFMSEPDGWWDDVLIAEMIELSKHTGDIIRTPLALKSQGFEQGNFHTSHYGGLYVFPRCQGDRLHCGRKAGNHGGPAGQERAFPGGPARNRRLPEPQRPGRAGLCAGQHPRRQHPEAKARFHRDRCRRQQRREPARRLPARHAHPQTQVPRQPAGGISRHRGRGPPPGGRTGRAVAAAG
ncbi:hypothetical protein QW131_18815 [Roseibium salinum]|nr:hypothetical protein [Roseibium salinum]